MANCKIFFLFLSFIFTFSTLSAQSINKISSKQFEYNQQVYKYGDMDPIFRKNDLAHDYYLQANRKFKTSKAWRNASLVGLGIGIAGIAVANRSDDLLDDTFVTGYVLAAAGGIIFPISGIIALTSHSKGKKFQKKSLEIFNETSATSNRVSKQIDMNVVISNGIGIQLRF